jgi:biopolymer transport protein ExbD
MASINVPGAGHRGRAVDHDVPLLPYIDFLLCLISFLLITAVWSETARLNANARVPGSGTSPANEEQVLHVDMKKDSTFVLNWRVGSTVVDSKQVPRNRDAELKGAAPRFDALRNTITEQWKLRGAHRSASDRSQDQAVLHTDNGTDFATITAVIDAIYGTQRELRLAEELKKIPAYNVTFAVD